MVSSVTTAFSVMSFLSFVLMMIPLSWHMEAGNVGTCFYMLWVGIMNLQYGINSIIWRHDATKRAVVWCDIAAKLAVGSNFAFPAVSLCINRRLYLISTVRSVMSTKQGRRRVVLVDLSICLLLPMIFMALHYIVQGHRFDIYEEFGCSMSVYNTWVAILLVSLPPVILSAISLYYSARCIFVIGKRAKESRDVLSSNSVTHMSRYLRLMILAGCDAFFSLPLSAYFLSVQSKPSSLHPWISFADTHLGFSYVGRRSAEYWRSIPGLVVSLEGRRWLPVAFALAFFALFGFADEAMKRYSSITRTITRHAGLSSFNDSATSITTSPRFNKTYEPNLSVNARSRVGAEKRDSLDSFSDLTSLDGDASRDSGSIKSGSPSSTSKPQISVKTKVVVLKDNGSEMTSYSNPSRNSSKVVVDVSRPPSVAFPSSVTSGSPLDIPNAITKIHNHDSGDNNV